MQKKAMATVLATEAVTLTTAKGGLMLTIPIPEESKGMGSDSMSITGAPLLRQRLSQMEALKSAIINKATQDVEEIENAEQAVVAEEAFGAQIVAALLRDPRRRRRTGDEKDTAPHLRLAEQTTKDDSSAATHKAGLETEASAVTSTKSAAVAENTEEVTL